MSDIKKVAVIGGGTMGNGIAHVFAMHGFDVDLVDTKQELLDRAVSTIEKNLDRMISREKISEDQKAVTLENIRPSLDLTGSVKEADLVVEAVPEIFSLKKQVFIEIDKHAPDRTIIATNTSSISITKLAAVTDRSEKFIGMHFFNPVPVMKLVEIVNGLETDPDVTEKIEKTSKKLGKVPIPVNDSPGFVSNRVLMPMINEAIYCVYEGVGTPEHIDQVMKLGMAHPMGPLRLADFIGLDVCLNILNVLYDGFKDPKYRACPLLVKMVDAGKLGDKTGIGFYLHD
jgi:3-hydroxybutyryl-CoA dehydrogenase